MIGTSLGESKEPWTDIPCPNFSLQKQICKITSRQCAQSLLFNTPILILDKSTLKFQCKETQFDVSLEEGLQIHSWSIQLTTIFPNNFEKEVNSSNQLEWLGLCMKNPII